MTPILSWTTAASGEDGPHDEGGGPWARTQHAGGPHAW